MGSVAYNIIISNLYPYPLYSDPILNSWNDRIRQIVIQYSMVYCRISQTLTEYSPSVQWDYPDTDWIFTQCIVRLARHRHNIHLVYCLIRRTLTKYWIVRMIRLGRLESNIQWCIVGLAGYWQNIHLVYCWISWTLTKYCRISRTPTQYSLGVLSD
jgi:hypothetical protein